MTIQVPAPAAPDGPPLSTMTSPKARGPRPSRRTRLARALDAHLAASPHVLSHFRDRRVEDIARILDLTLEGVVVRAACLRRRTVTVAAVPGRVWSDRWLRAEVLRLRILVRRTGGRLVLVPGRLLLREPRLGNAFLVSGCAGAKMTPEDRFAVIDALIEEPGMTLGDLAGLVRGPATDPVGAVLSLVAQGIVEIDARRPIGPLTQAWMHRAYGCGA